jgi:lipid A 4'-phosphatase
MTLAPALIAGSSAVLVLFGVWPELDLATSRLFFDGEIFALDGQPLNLALRWVLRVTPFLPVLAGLFVLLGARWLPAVVLGLSRRGWAAIVLTMILGPGLLVNRLLKAHWGRARPRDVVEFGGTAQFTPPHQWAEQCAANCSFVSGEVSAVTALSLALTTLLLANRDRIGRGGLRALLAGIWTLPLLSAYQRISVGAHFLSDTVLAVLFTALTALLVQRIVAPKAR